MVFVLVLTVLENAFVIALVIFLVFFICQCRKQHKSNDDTRFSGNHCESDDSGFSGDHYGSDDTGFSGDHCETERIDQDKENTEMTDHVHITVISKHSRSNNKLANILLGKWIFDLKDVLKENTECQAEDNLYAPHKLTVINTPGLYDNKVNIKETIAEITKKCNKTHKILFTWMHPIRWTAEDQNFHEVCQELYETYNKENIGLVIEGFRVEPDEEWSFKQFVQQQRKASHTVYNAVREDNIYEFDHFQKRKNILEFLMKQPINQDINCKRKQI